MHLFLKFILEWNSTCFGQFLCPSSGVFHSTHSNEICHSGLQTAFEQDRDETLHVSDNSFVHHQEFFTLHAAMGICHSGLQTAFEQDWDETLHVSDNSSVHHQEFFTVHTAMEYVIEVCRQLSSRIGMFHPPSWSCSKAVYKPEMTYTIAACTVKNSWWWTKELCETCTASFQNKFEKLVHLVGFIIRICHDARSRERKIQLSLFELISCNKHVYMFRHDIKPSAGHTNIHT